MFDTVKLTATLGSEVRGVDLTGPLAPAATEALRALLVDRGVLVFRDQHPSAEAHLALGAALGRLAPRNPMYPHVDGHEQIMVIRDDPTSPPENETWHSDLSFKADPPFAALLHGVVIPEAGGDTLWADMRAVHDALSAPMRAMLAEVTAVHTQEQGFAFLRGTDQSGRVAALEAQDRAANAARHPAIRHHPISGRPILYANEAFTSHLDGLAPAEGRAVLALLTDMVRNPRFQLRVRWSPGTLVIWDNWSTQHFASADHWPAEREVRRVTVLSDARTGRFGEPATAEAA